jgi:CRISPR-associated protein Cas1
MRKLLNTLYVNTQGSYLRKEGETIVVEQEKKKVLQVPVHTIGGIVLFGNVLCSPFLLGFCAEKDVGISYMTEQGRFLASVNGPVRGNVLLRRDQYRYADDAERTKAYAASFVAAKIANSRIIILRTLRDHRLKVEDKDLETAAWHLAEHLKGIDAVSTTAEIRGIEGAAAAKYFGAFNHLIIEQKDDFMFNTRSRRPPLDEVNALLSFTYTLLAHDIRSALETVGLDPAVGYLHRDRPGRPGLALDLMEELRPVIADRTVLSLINRRQLKKKDFKQAENGAVTMSESARKVLLIEYQNRKQTEIYHPYLQEKIPLGLIFFVQANLLARSIRGDIDGYPPFFWR